jgi:hypothetical protein
VVLSLVLADILLVALTLYWPQRVDGRLDAGSTTACVVGILLAGWLGCVAAWVHFRSN